MAEKTPNFNLTKPLESEFYDINVQNGNMDKIDQALQGHADQIFKLQEGAGTEIQETLTAHINNKNNPHGVTAADVGAAPPIVTVSIEQTLCEDVELSDDAPSFSFERQINIESNALYYLSLNSNEADGSIIPSENGYIISKPSIENDITFVRWGSASSDNCVIMTEQAVTDTWRRLGKKHVISIYRVNVVVDQMLKTALLHNSLSIALGNHSAAEGSDTTATGVCSHAEGYGTTASGYTSHAEGSDTTATGVYSHAEGYRTTASKYASHAEGMNTISSGDCSHAEGSKTSALTNGSHAEGTNTTVSGYTAHAEGWGTTASGYAAHAEGYYTTASNVTSHAGGKYNKAMIDGGTSYDKVGDAFVIGNGTRDNDKSNAFRITFMGETYGLTSFKTSGADYAEYFEWQDGNPQADDRVGRFVTMTGRHIRIAAPGDYILGVVSGQPCIIGNADEDWLGRWEHDEFGRFVKRYMVEDKTEIDPPADDEARTELLHDPQVKEENGRWYRSTPRYVDYETPSWDYKPNPDYDASQPYIERRDRQEWDAVGMLGVLPVWDDGTCQVDGWCQPAKDGTATNADAYIPGQTYRVIERVCENVVKIVFR